MIYGRGPGEIVVPPSCPSVVDSWQRLDLSRAELDYWVADFDENSKGECTTTEAGLSFYPEGSHKQGVMGQVMTGVVDVRADSDISKKAYMIADEFDEGDPTKLNKVRAVLCERVLTCRGIVRGALGPECWALGEMGLTAAINEAVDELPES